jgi:hypothetical protein
VQNSSVAVNGDLQIVSACEHRYAHTRSEALTDNACETLAKGHLDRPSQDAAFSM